MSMTRDLKNNVKEEKSLDPKALTASANGAPVDTRDFDSAIMVVYGGNVSDGTHTPTMEESDSSGSGFTTVAAADLEGTLAAITSSSIQRVGYKGNKRFIRGVITVSGASTGAVEAISFVLGTPHATATPA